MSEAGIATARKPMVRPPALARLATRHPRAQRAMFCTTGPSRRASWRTFGSTCAPRNASRTQVAALTRARLPDLDIPAHSRFAHFDAGGVRRLATAERSTSHAHGARACSARGRHQRAARRRRRMAWRYREARQRPRLGRSEGLARGEPGLGASGGLSSRGRAYEVDAKRSWRSRGMDVDRLATAFQVGACESAGGRGGRVRLLRALGDALAARPRRVRRMRRPGALVRSALSRRAGRGSAARRAILSACSPAGQHLARALALDGVPLGESGVTGGRRQGLTQGLVPFHKLSQWLSYSLLHPLRPGRSAGRRPRRADGPGRVSQRRLFVDTRACSCPSATPRRLRTRTRWAPSWWSSGAHSRWRCSIGGATGASARLGVDAERMPLASVLEGGTWAAGRELAASARATAVPRFASISDGTVF